MTDFDFKLYACKCSIKFKWAQLRKNIFSKVLMDEPEACSHNMVLCYKIFSLIIWISFQGKKKKNSFLFWIHLCLSLGKYDKNSLCLTENHWRTYSKTKIFTIKVYGDKGLKLWKEDKQYNSTAFICSEYQMKKKRKL